MYYRLYGKTLEIFDHDLQIEDGFWHGILIPCMLE